MSIKGADIIDSTTFPVVPGHHKWERHGLQLYIPEDSVDLSTPPLTMSIHASISGQYQLPDNTDLVSGIYWIICPQKFPEKHSVTLILQHCAIIEHPEQLDSFSFITANCTQKMLPYKFEEILGGVFSTDNCLGSIQLYHFSGYGVVGKKRKREEVERGTKRVKEEAERSYVIRAYYISQGANNWLTHIVVVWNSPTYLRVGFFLQ